MLQKVLAGIEVYPDPNVLVGYQKADDAGVYRLEGNTALLQSVDFFTPIVDDPFTYGQIAAANALSDIYAMGGRPRFALSIVAFPNEDLELEVLHEILRGGNEKMIEARVAVIGGHSVQDREIKFGYCVTGLVDADRMYTNAGARPGDALVLTKPLGTGIVATGIKYAKAPLGCQQQAVQWMLKLNAAAAAALPQYQVHAVTDITGYGLLGHALEMAAASDVTLSLKAEAVPVLEGAEELLGKGMVPGGAESNRRFVEAFLSWDGIAPWRQQLLLDPQTSGGLLVSLPEEEAEALAEELQRQGFAGARVGRVSPAEPFRIKVE